MPDHLSTLATWTDEYESILEFYFWEPQHLNCVSPPKAQRKPLSAVLAALRKKEVPLNHLFSIFLSLAPAALCSRLICAIAPEISGTSAKLLGGAEVRRSKLSGICQPDLALNASGRLVFLELKIRARTSTEQLLKYALAGAVMGGDQCPAVILVGESSAFPQADEFDRQRQAHSLVISEKTGRQARRLNVSEEQLLRAAIALQICCSSYRAIRDHLRLEYENVDINSEGGETLRKLILGMNSALDFRFRY